MNCSTFLSKVIAKFSFYRTLIYSSYSLYEIPSVDIYVHIENDCSRCVKSK